jgi:hypothetical protein
VALRRVVTLACLITLFTHTGAANADVPAPSIALTGTYFEAHADGVPGASAETFQLVTAHGAYDLAGPVEAESGQRVTVTARQSPGGLVVKEASPAAPRAPAALAAGPKTILAIPVTWGSISQPVTQSAAAALLNGDVAAWYAETSYGGLTVSATSTPVLTIPDPGACNASAIQTSAISAAQTAGYAPSSYTNRMIIVPKQYCGWGGLGQVGGPTSWVRGDQWSLRVPVHELGHNLGLRLWHSNALLCTDAQTLACAEHEYYNPYDAMGLAWEGVGHFGAPQKDALGWLDGRKETITAGGAVTLAPIELATAGAGETQAVRIVTAHRTYWLEYRTPQLFDLFATHPPNGVYVTIEQLAGVSTAEGPMLLDMHPATSIPTPFADASYERMLDAALTAGETYTDPWSELSVTVESTGATAQLMLTVGTDLTPPAAPALSGPAKNQALRTETPTLSWSAATDTGGSGLAGYDVVLDGVAVSWPGPGATSYAVSSPLAEGSHTWSVAARDAAGNRTESPARTFWVDRTPPAAFAVSAPGAGATVRVRRPTVTWSAPTDAHSGLALYRVLVDGRLDRVVSSSGNATRIARLLPRGSHTVRVVAVDRAGNARATAIVRFTVRL